MKEPHLVKVYDLHDDQESIRRTQEATLHTETFGLKPHGLFGSNEWWEAIETGQLPKQVLEGTISRVYWTGMGPVGDFPEVEVTSDTGEKTAWYRYGDSERDPVYHEGRRVRITYVLQQAKYPGDTVPHKIPLTVEVEP